MTSIERKSTRAMSEVESVRAILRRWDPIGIEPGEFGPADEYDCYAPRIVSLVAQGCSAARLARHLEQIRTSTIGLDARPERDSEIAHELVASLRKDPL